MTHSKEPWRWRARDAEATGRGYEIVDADGDAVIDDGSAHGEYGQKIDPHGEDAARIIACVNALAGIPTETLLALSASGKVVRRLEFAEPGAPEANGAETWTAKIKPADADKLLDAARVLVEQHVGDHVYDVREREGMGWDGPMVTAWSKAAVALGEVVSRYPVATPECLDDDVVF